MEDVAVLQSGGQKAEGVPDRHDSRYIRRADPHFTEVPSGFAGKFEWVAVHSWDRKYEYCFASTFAMPGAVAAEIGVGTFHPFIYFLGSRCKRVYGVDLDEQIVDLLRDQPAITPLVVNFAEVDRHIPEPLDAAFSVSALEHMDERDIAAGLRAVYKLLKPGGVFAVTFDVLMGDYPNKWNMSITKQPHHIMAWATEAGFRPAGDVRFDFDPGRDICKNIDMTRQTPKWFSCYRALLVK